jgi:hypothetical protein
VGALMAERRKGSNLFGGARVRQGGELLVACQLLG